MPFAIPLQAEPAAAAQWQQEWSTQVHAVGAAQQELRSEGVGLHTHDALASAERAAGQLEHQLQELKEGGGG